MNPGLPPVVGASPRILLLGSFPSNKALGVAEYYANKRNQFWDLCAALFGVDANAPYPERLSALKARGVALWDVLAQAERNEIDFGIVAGSGQPNDLRAFLDQHASIRVIGLNGRRASELFTEYFPDLRERGLRIVELPSSRAAHEPLPFEEKLRSWSMLAS